MTTPKRSSYPSRQLRGGPAPLASFEDLSDEISSPEEPAALLSPDPDGGETEEDDDTKTCSEGATPSTPRVLAQTPSTPLALDGFSAAGTPDSFGHLDVFPGSSSRPTTPLPPPPDSFGHLDVFPSSRPTTPLPPPQRQDSAASRSSLFSPRASPLFGRRSMSTTPEPVDHRDSNSSLDGAAGRAKPAPGTPSPCSTRKLFTMSFFKPREDKTPSPTASPCKSPRRTSPAASPKSPRRASPFSGLFKGGTKEESDATASPTKKRSHHFPYFLRPKEERRPAPPQPLPQEPASPVEPGKKNRVFGNLFTRAHHKGAAVPPPPLQTPEDEEWSAAPPAVQAFRALQSPGESTAPAPLPPAVTEPTEDVSWLSVTEAPRPILAALKLEPPGKNDDAKDTDAGIFESSQDILGAEAAAQYGPSLQLGLSPSAGEVQVAPAEPAPPAAGLESPESEAEAPEADPAVILKAVLDGKEPEAETLLREDSFEGEEFPAPDVTQGGEAAPPPEKETSRHRDKLATFRANPVDRPRCTAPMSFSSLEAYISKAAQPGAAVQPAADRAKLKVVLPGEEFEQHRERQPKRAVYKSWFEFCEVGLQSPRSRRRQLSARSPSSFPERREVVVVTRATDERRAESVDLGAMGASEAWASFETETREAGERRGGEPRSESSSRSSSPGDDGDYGAAELNPALLKDEEVEPLMQSEERAEEPAAGPDSDYATDLRATTRIGQAPDPGARSSIRSLPDCVFSVGGEPEAPSCWANGVMDLLASLPSPKQQEPARVTNGGGRLQDVRTGYEP